MPKPSGAEYNVWCIDQSDAVGNVNEVASLLTDMFTKVVHVHKHFQKVNVYFPRFRPSPTDSELLIYFLPDIRSVVTLLSPDSSADVQQIGYTGWAWVDGFVRYGSEVYVPRIGASDSNLLAKAAFHELMHNKLGLDDKKLHPMGGLAGKTIGPETKLTNSNIHAMGSKLLAQRKQWIEGWDALVERKINPTAP